jgi:hypothetical protein
MDEDSYDEQRDEGNAAQEIDKEEARPAAHYKQYPSMDWAKT